MYAYPSEYHELWSRERPELDSGPGTFGEQKKMRFVLVFLGAFLFPVALNVTTDTPPRVEKSPAP